MIESKFAQASQGNWSTPVDFNSVSPTWIGMGRKILLGAPPGLGWCILYTTTWIRCQLFTQPHTSTWITSQHLFWIQRSVPLRPNTLSNAQYPGKCDLVQIFLEKLDPGLQYKSRWDRSRRSWGKINFYLLTFRSSELWKYATVSRWACLWKCFIFKTFMCELWTLKVWVWL